MSNTAHENMVYAFIIGFSMGVITVLLCNPIPFNQYGDFGNKVPKITEEALRKEVEKCY